MSDRPATTSESTGPSVLLVAVLVAIGGVALLGIVAFGLATGSDTGPSTSDDATVTAEDAWASVSVDTAAAYVTLDNSGGPDTLVGASSPAADTVSLMLETEAPGSHDGDHSARLELPTGTTTLGPGVAHVMLEDLTEPVEPGQTIELRLEFDHADPLTVDAKVLDWDEVVDRLDNVS